MDFARAYALGLYHQRCGTDNVLPYTRFTHDECHTAASGVPTAAPPFRSPGRRLRITPRCVNPDNPRRHCAQADQPRGTLFPFRADKARSTSLAGIMTPAITANTPSTVPA